MRISAKGRYALAAVTLMARSYGTGECVTVISIAQALGISKIYLEQIFSLLKRDGLVLSVKGAQGGYRLTRMPGQITALDVLSAAEPSLFEGVEDTVRDSAPDIEAAMRLSAFDKLDGAIRATLENVTLENLVNEAQQHRDGQGFMFYI